MTSTLSCGGPAKHGTLTLFFLLLLSPQILFPVGAQPVPNPYGPQRFSPSMAIIIVILIAALFLMGFLSIYLRHCSSEAQSASVRAGAGTRTGRSRRGGASRGLDATVIDTFPTLEYTAVKGLKIGKGALECAVCLNEFEDDETLRLIPKCDHVFHPECIDAWLASHTTCPVCRANLVPQPGEPVPQLSDFNSQQQQQDDVEAQNDAVDLTPEHDHQETVEQPDSLSLNQTLNRNRTRRSRSSRLRRLFPRSHSTGHSLVQPGENTERFTLRLPVEVRKQIMNRELNRSVSLLVLTREGSSRRGPRTGESGGSNRLRNYRRLEPLDREVKSDRWVFARTPSFLTRMSSLLSPRVAAKDDEKPMEPAMSRSGSVRPPV